MKHHRFCEKYFPLKWAVLIVYYLWYKVLIESYYFPCVKKTIEQIFQNMCLLICKLIIMAYLSVQNILFSNKRLK